MLCRFIVLFLRFYSSVLTQQPDIVQWGSSTDKSAYLPQYQILKLWKILWWRNWDFNAETGDSEIGTPMKKLWLWRRNWHSEIETLMKQLGLWKWDPNEVVETLMKKSGPWWRYRESEEEIETLKLGSWWRNWDSEEEIGTLMKKSGPWWRKWDSYEEIGTLMKTHPAVIYLSVRSRLPPPLMIIALAAGSSLCLDWYASFRVSLRFCAVVQLHLSWCIPYIYKVVRDRSNLNQLPNEWFMFFRVCHLYQTLILNPVLG